MSMPSPSPSPSFVSWGLALAASSLLLIGGGTMFWSKPATCSPSSDEPFTGQLLVVSKDMQVPHYTPDGRAADLHSVSYVHENGTRVVKIRVSPEGDELIVDASTGRLIEARPARGRSRPTGHIASPAVPVT
jgi:hypothetical protein